MTGNEQIKNAFESIAYAVNHECDNNSIHAAHAYTVAGWCASIAARLFRESGDDTSACSASNLAHDCRENAARVYNN